MKLVDLIGTSAATLTTGCFVPQVVRLWRTRNAEGISLVTFSAFSVGVALWLAYGVIMEAWPIILSNATTLVLAFAIIVLTVRFRRRD
ncbi:MAG: SemiSWEET transporter [Opitutaceae bacterium]